jgi:hypothetical protein
MISHGVRRRLHDESRALRDWRRGFGRVIRRIARFDGEPKEAASDPPLGTKLTRPALPCCGAQKRLWYCNV